MDESAPDILILERRIEPRELARLTRLFFEDMVKYVVDVERRMIAIGGELHADAERLLLDSGSRLSDVWGANYYPGTGREGCIEYTSSINHRPALGNHSVLIEDPAIRERVREVTFELIGQGEPLG